MDGVPGIQQCPIPPGGSFTYSFIADLYGTSWYHSHYSAQYVFLRNLPPPISSLSHAYLIRKLIYTRYAGGLIGPMIIHGPQTVSYDIGKLIPVLFGGWKSHADYPHRQGTNHVD
jgi:hypothetical protein